MKRISWRKKVDSAASRKPRVASFEGFFGIRPVVDLIGGIILAGVVGVLIWLRTSSVWGAIASGVLALALAAGISRANHRRRRANGTSSYED